MSRLSACLQGLRLLSHHPVDQGAVSALCAQFPFIEGCMVRLEGGGTCVAQLRAEADNLIHSIHCEETEAKVNSNPPSTFLANLKEKLPSQRERLPGLRPGIDEEMTDDPEAMATLAGDYWAKVWLGTPPLPRRLVASSRDIIGRSTLHFARPDWIKTISSPSLTALIILVLALMEYRLPSTG